jgi:hypothetical protein
MDGRAAAGFRRLPAILQSTRLIEEGAIMLSMMIATFTLLSAALANYWDGRRHR